MPGSSASPACSGEPRPACSPHFFSGSAPRLHAPVASAWLYCGQPRSPHCLSPCETMCSPSQLSPFSQLCPYHRLFMNDLQF